MLAFRGCIEEFIDFAILDSRQCEMRNNRVDAVIGASMALVKLKFKI